MPVRFPASFRTRRFAASLGASAAMIALVTGPGVASAVAAPQVRENASSTTAAPYAELIARHSNKCLDVQGASSADGADVIQWPCNNGTNQQWKLIGAGNGYFSLQARHSGQCLDVAGGSTANGANVIQWPCNGGANQKWRRG